ncbi:cytochrome P450 [Coprinopsis cinerea okayama7|uniref:Cytochrome P450 n=1 Tax=Coprinopsis cinerea (strain Okayama-7 / 130 / ATCC MYA-4618 / FGSC 9003) TaxID=240176 RepID=A8P3W7_COPC7|nr:cytochrome P450 [Coprinopsis cinerea okayama7\|eukprot:XP_001838624.2 cytochrome P450 [Coprinopsis cinerea okayama7\
MLQFWRFDLAIALASGVTAATALVLATYKRVRNRSRLPKPPGPKGYPIIGNLFDVPSKRSWIGYKELSEKYGIMDLGGYMTVMPYGTRLNRHRKMFRQHIESNDISKWYPIIRRQVFDCMKAVAAIPDSWNTHFNHLFTSMMVEITYGVKTKSLQDPFIKDMMEAALGFAQAALPGSFLVDTFPILKYVPTWFPGAYFKRFAAYYKAVDYKARNDPKFDHVTRAMKAGTSRPCVVSSMVEALPEENDPTRAEEETIARNVAAMIHAVGYGRMPEFSDKESLVQILHDPETFEDPFAFKPERYIKDGKQLSDSGEDENGKPTIKYGVTDGALSHPEPFEFELQ